MKKFKRNNPLNIRYSEKNDWDGQVGCENGFCVFKSAEYGFRAGFKLIKNYYHNGFCSVRAIISRFAPPSENPTEDYIAFVSDKMQRAGYDAYGIDFEWSKLDLVNDMAVVDLITAMAEFESGQKIQYKEVKGALTRLGVITCDDEPTGVVGMPL